MRINHAVIQKCYFAPITHPSHIPPTKGGGKKKFRPMLAEIPTPIFPMSDGKYPFFYIHHKKVNYRRQSPSFQTKKEDVEWLESNLE